MPKLPEIVEDRQAVFIAALAQGRGFLSACQVTGYGNREGYALLQTVRISKTIEDRMRVMLQSDYAPAALKFLGDLVSDKAAPLKERRQAAQFLLEKAGYVAPKAKDHEPNDKAISAMSADELATLVEKLENERFSRSKPINQDQSPAHDAQVTEMLS